MSPLRTLHQIFRPTGRHRCAPPVVMLDQLLAHECAPCLTCGPKAFHALYTDGSRTCRTCGSVTAGAQ